MLMTTLASRVQMRMAVLDLTQDEVAARAGISQTAIQKIISGKTKETRKIMQLAQALECNAVWLGTGDGNPEAGLIAINTTLPGLSSAVKIESNATYLGGFDLWDESTPLTEDEVALPFYREIALAAGSGRAHQVIENHGLKLRFAKSTLRKRSVMADNAYCVTVAGNSMEPVLPDGTTIGIDTGNTTIKNGDIYALDHAGELRVKMVYRLPGGGLRLRSFNSDEWPDEHYTEAEAAENIKILGRMFWSSTLW